MTPVSATSLMGACLVLALMVSPGALAQKAAERYIPLGQSPGLSGQYTLLGVIAAGDPTTGILTVEASDRGLTRLLVSPRSRIWVDHSARGRASQPGTWSDLAPGNRVEALPLAGRPEEAEWIKVEPATTP